MTFAISEHERLKAALETVRETVLIIDSRLDRPGRTIVYANLAFGELTGYTRRGTVGTDAAIAPGCGG